MRLYLLGVLTPVVIILILFACMVWVVWEDSKKPCNHVMADDNCWQCRERLKKKCWCMKALNHQDAHFTI